MKPRTGFLAALLVAILIGIGAVYSFDAGVLGRMVETMLAALAGAALVALLMKGGTPDATRPGGPATQWRVLRTVSITVFLLVLLGAVLIYVGRLWPPGRTLVTQIISVGLFAGAVGYAELLARYRDDPGRLLAADPTAIYVAVNMIAGIGALALVKEFAVFGAADSPVPHQATYEALFASFGAIAFFRTSLFTARVGGSDIDIGPATLLKSLLASSDFMVNRKQAADRADEVQRTMATVDFDKAKSTLPVLCFTLVEGMTEDQQKLVAEQIKRLADDTTIESGSKATILGVYLLRQVGSDVLARAVTVLGDRIRL